MAEFILKYWLEVIFGIAVAGLTFCYNRLTRKFKEQEAIKDGLVAILHDRLLQSGLYFIEKNEITVSALHNIEGMYVAYHNLGGNGTGTEIYERVKELPIKK